MKRRGDTVVELFCGIGGFRIAADRLGLRTVWANDAKATACSVYRARFGDAELHVGDVKELLPQIPAHDLLTAGFPCQAFSAAGKKAGIRDPRGTLFQVVVEVLLAHRPAHFVLENVKRLVSMESGSHFATILEALASLNYAIEWRILNAVDFGLPQNRQRIFIVGTRLPKPGDWTPVTKLAVPGDLNLSAGQVKLFSSPERWTAISDHGVRFAEWGVALDGRFYSATPTSFGAARPCPRLFEVLQDSVDPEFDFTESTLQRLGASEHVNKFFQGVQILSNQAGGARMGYTVFGTEGVAPTLTASTSRHYERYKIGERYRRLTNVEYARLQGFPDDHATAASQYDQYELYGNAVPPPMAAWAIEQVRTLGEPLLVKRAAPDAPRRAAGNSSPPQIEMF